MLERVRNARLAVLGMVEPQVRRKATDRRNDIVITYVDGEGKSGQKYASLFAEENLIAAKAIIPPSSFQESYRKHCDLHGVPKIIVMVDDFVGTGESLATNMEKFHDDNLVLLSDDGPLVFVFSLLATAEGQEALLSAISKLEYSQMNFRAGEILDGSTSIFGGEKGVFTTVEERDRAKAVAIELGATIDKNAPLGYGDQGLAVVFPTTTPNNSLPLLHTHGKGAAPQWRPLFERLVN